MPETGHILGIEGTAWNLSAAVFGDDRIIALYSSPYRPPSGGIHPREAAQHHAGEMKAVISEVLTDPSAIKAVAFSQGPGLGPCLRTVATAARAIAVSLGVPLVGVNHCVAHVEIGRWACGCDDPIVLYASGANTQVLGYLGTRYRIFGETLDIGLGNGLDKFAQAKGMTHPGGPQIEALAREGDPISLPYTVKGMDLAFSGVVSAAQEAQAPLEDVCAGLQETAFSMCVEVTERALAHSGKDEVLLVGGVGANGRLQEMLRTMCEERGATFHVPERKFIGDNGAMIAYTGSLMLAAGQTLPVAESAVNPGYRSDEVVVGWRDAGADAAYALADVMGGGSARGAEAVVTSVGDDVLKQRLPKGYRTHSLDHRLILERTRVEARMISAARAAGVRTPVIRDVTADTIRMERIEGALLKHVLTPEHIYDAGVCVGRLHGMGIIHGDLTTSNVIISDEVPVFIDFGLSYRSDEIEPQGVDIHVLFQTLESTSSNAECLKDEFVRGYCMTFSGAADVIKRVDEIHQRGRYL